MAIRAANRTPEAGLNAFLTQELTHLVYRNDFSHDLWRIHFALMHDQKVSPLLPALMICEQH